MLKTIQNVWRVCYMVIASLGIFSLQYLLPLLYKLTPWRFTFQEDVELVEAGDQRMMYRLMPDKREVLITKQVSSDLVWASFSIIRRLHHTFLIIPCEGVKRKWVSSSFFLNIPSIVENYPDFTRSLVFKIKNMFWYLW